MKLINRVSLRKMVILSIISFFIIYMCTYLFIDIYFVNKMFVEKEYDALENIQIVQKKYIESWLIENLNMMVFLAKSKSAQDNEITRLEQNAKGFSSINKRFRNISYIGLDGYAVFSTGFKLDKKISVSDREYFKQALEGKPYISEFLKSRGENDYIIVFSAPVYDNSAKKVKGVLIGSVSAEEVVQALKWNSTRKTSSTYLLNKDGVLLMNTFQSSNTGLTADVEKLLYPFKNGEFKAGVHNNYKGEKVIVVYSEIGFIPGGYTIATEINYDEATLDIRNRIALYFVFCGIVFLLIGKKVYDAFGKRYFKQLKMLVGTAQSYTAASVYSPIKAEYKNEIGELIHIFDEMMRSINAYQHELKDKLDEIDNDRNILRENNIKLKLLSEKHEVAMRILSQKNNELDEANKAKSNFIANVSHELRNPLNVIINYLEYVLEENDGFLNHEQRKNIEISLKNAARLQGMINDLLDLSSLETGKVRYSFCTVNIAKLLCNICKDREREIKAKGLDWTFVINTEMTELVTDETRLRQIIDNIIGNSIKFSNQGRIEITLNNDGKNMEIAIKDQGIGIEKEKIGNIFEPFYQADSSLKKKYNGVGLGLSICKKIADSLGGKITAENNPEKGCTFRVLLPMKPLAKGE